MNEEQFCPGFLDNVNGFLCLVNATEFTRELRAMLLGYLKSLNSGNTIAHPNLPENTECLFSLLEACEKEQLRRLVLKHAEPAPEE